jgi:hypothetical protein
MPKTRRKLTTCGNCSTALVNDDNYCPKCGQENHDKQVSTIRLANDFVEDYIGFDNKFIRSIVPLLIRPGVMTANFLEGKRKKYISPIRLFLFLSFIFFGLNYFLDLDTQGNITIDGREADQELSKSFMSSMVDNFQYVAFAFVPIQALILMLFFRTEKHRYYVNFFVYTLHLFSFLFFVFSMFVISGLIFPDELNIWIELSVVFCFIGYIIYYSVISLKRVFQKKYNILLFIITFLMSLFSFIIILLGYVYLTAWIYAL